MTGQPSASATLFSIGKPLGLATRGESLHVDDLVVAGGEHHEPLLVASAGIGPGRRPDDLVPDLHELRVDRDLAGAVLPALKLQDLPGLVGTPSTGRVLPPQVPASDAPPFAVLVKQCDEGLDIPIFECVDRGPQLVDHELIVEARAALGDAFSRGLATTVSVMR